MTGSGSDFTVLSLVPLLSRSIKVTEAVPFSEELRHQYGTEVSCLPYTISPFTVLDIASSLSPRDSKVDDDVHFTPTSIIPNLVRFFIFPYTPNKPLLQVCSISRLGSSLSSTVRIHNTWSRHCSLLHDVYRSIHT